MHAHAWYIHGQIRAMPPIRMDSKGPLMTHALLKNAENSVCLLKFLAISRRSNKTRHKEAALFFVYLLLRI